MAKDKIMDKLIFSYSLRCRIETRWAMSLRANRSSQDANHAWKLIKDAESDLTKFEGLLNGSNAPVQPVKDYEFLQTKLEAMLALGEIETDRMLFVDAGRHLGYARKTIRKLPELLQNGGVYRFPTWRKSPGD